MSRREDFRAAIEAVRAGTPEFPLTVYLDDLPVVAELAGLSVGEAVDIARRVLERQATVQN